MPIRFCKYQALGNDYLVLAEPRYAQKLSTAAVRRICHRHLGVGADGMLAARDALGSLGVIIWNSDGSRAEKSGNGLRIFARYLWDEGQMDDNPRWITTDGGDVQVQILDRGQRVQVEMGTLSFGSVNSVTGQPLPTTLDCEGRAFEVYIASLGNPHCVTFFDEPSESRVRQWGPLLEQHAAFPERTNVQFAAVRDRNRLDLQIWERGSGYTLSSGSSASAAAGVASGLGLVDPQLVVNMPGGTLEVSVDKDRTITICGPVEKVAEIFVDKQLLGLTDD